MPRGIGNMREQLAIRRKVKTSDGQGSTVSWTTLDTIDAEHVPLQAAESQQAEQVTAQVDARFRTRARADITTTMRASWTPAWPPSSTRKIFEIHGIEPDPDDVEFMFLNCGSTEETE